jgi:hypothetical protein
VEDAEQVGGHQQGERPRRDNPTEKAADEPVSLPSPAFDAAKRYVEAARSEAAHPVKHNTERGIRSQEEPFVEPVCFRDARL